MGRQGTSSQKSSLNLGFSTKPIFTNTETMLPKHGQMFEYKQHAFYTSLRLNISSMLFTPPSPTPRALHDLRVMKTMFIFWQVFVYLLCHRNISHFQAAKFQNSKIYPWFLFLTKLRKASCSLSFKVFSFVPVSDSSFIWRAFLRIESWKHTNYEVDNIIRWC